MAVDILIILGGWMRRKWFYETIRSCAVSFSNLKKMFVRMCGFLLS